MLLFQSFTILALRKSLQVMRSWKVFPEDFSHVVKMAREQQMPMQSNSSGFILASEKIEWESGILFDPGNFKAHPSTIPS